jgi:2-polyprenyl-3-methyl-5-hydroxy-6-metoxy-1,4-benzoquinol methylase
MNQQDLDKTELAQLRAKIAEQRTTIDRLRKRMESSEKALAWATADETNRWLYVHREERMDATVPFFDSVRTEFHLDRYRFASPFVANSRVADIACGTGYGCRILAEVGKAEHVTGIDCSAEAIEYARRHHSGSAIEYRVGDACQTGIPGDSLDWVVSFETLEHVPDEAAMLREFARILRPGGGLICSTPNQWPLEIAPYHVRVHDRSSFEAALAVQFDVEQIYNQNSGSDWKYNHQQPRSISPTSKDHESTAECFIALCRKK